MHERARWLVAALALCAASTALAVKTGEDLYVKARNTRLMASASPTANVVTVLQPGQKVTWLGADPKNKQWHRVKVSEKQQGLVFQSNLSTQPPNLELVSKGTVSQEDLKSMASSGAAVRGLSEGAVKYGNGKQAPGFTEAVTQVKELEKLALEITPQDLAGHATKTHLFPVVGPRDTASRGGK
jgi:uncharacterized protein YgiM (DUF1202 family)